MKLSNFYLILLCVCVCACGQKKIVRNENLIDDILVKNDKIFVFLQNKTVLKFTRPIFLDEKFSFSRDKNAFKINEYDTHYGNRVSMFFNYNTQDTTLYLKKIDGFFPFKQDTLGRNKYCTMELNRDIKKIDSERLFDEFNTDKYCELRKEK